MGTKASSFEEFVREGIDPEANKLRDLNLLPQIPFWKRWEAFTNGFEKDDGISEAITAFDEAVQKYIDAHFTKEEQMRSKEFDGYARTMRVDTNDLKDRTWMEWYWSH